MAKDERENDGKQILARRLAKEIGISEMDARELINLLGTDWNNHYCVKPGF